MKLVSMLAMAEVTRFRPLSRGPFFNHLVLAQHYYDRNGFRPLSRGPFFNLAMSTLVESLELWFSSPFSGTFFQ